ncbi:hypothetical protein Q5P01_000537 [Channa striata]|uniref:Uncharacterized protein n=1 Tax=Channa striata TaxID=64152 RepID=A0AA88IIN4_CHASR|nr:hypothetical protein Q5P01_000537 [Channa striata]
MKLLARRGHERKLFLVTGRVGSRRELAGSSAGLGGDLVSFHFRYLDCRELEEDRSLLVAPDPRGSRGAEEFSDLDPSYCGGEIRRPGDSPGYYVSTFAEPAARGWRRYAACRGAGAPKPTRCWWSWLTPWRSRDSVPRETRTWSRFSRPAGGRSDSETGQQELSRGSGDATRPPELLSGEPERARGSGLPPGGELSRRSLRALCGVQLGGEGLLPALRSCEDLAHPGGPRGASFRSERSTTCTGRRQRLRRGLLGSRDRCGAARRSARRLEPPDFHGMAWRSPASLGYRRRSETSTGRCEMRIDVQDSEIVCDLWALKKPQIGPNAASPCDVGWRFLGESREALPSPPSP